jgi:hypothetical protein
MNVLVKGVLLIVRIAAKSDAKSGYITQGFQYCVFTYVNKERIMTTHQAMTADTMIPSGSIPARSRHAYTLNQRDTRAVKFSGVRSSGQYCRPEIMRQSITRSISREMNGHTSWNGMCT